MPITIYSAPGCLRCKIVKQFIDNSDRGYQDVDALGEGRKAFSNFYRDHRDQIYRGPEGVEFPIFSEGETVRQGLPGQGGEGPAAVETFVRDGRKVGRNEPCPCGSGKKYKRCHGQLS